ncbi:hypothetical protein GGR54DRAFT_626962 [Hypoxylon sp. NC1633]|nr:hypothetical protein GGR54DRAFT_626962 [Hypoxylon sp. NC1633]
MSINPYNRVLPPPLPPLRDARDIVHLRITEPDRPPIATSANVLIQGANVANGKKRKSESSLEDDIAEYKRNLDFIPTDHLAVDLTSDQVRDKIAQLLCRRIMNPVEIAEAFHTNPDNLKRFLFPCRSSLKGCTSDVHVNAWRWIKQRETLGLKMPDVQKRQKITTSAAACTGPQWNQAINGSSVLAQPKEISQVYLDGEETDTVPVYDTCDEIRKKIKTQIDRLGMTRALLCHNLYAQLAKPKGTLFQPWQVNEFLSIRGLYAGCSSQIFYAAYVYFEKKRIAEGKPKSQDRLKMEEIWSEKGCLDMETGAFGRICLTAGELSSCDQYG